MKIIGEIGVNHNGSVALAKQLIETVKAAGADAVKLQYFDPAKMVTKSAPLAEYQKKAKGIGDSQLEMLEALKLERDDIFELKAHADTLDIEFVCSVFDVADFEMLDELQVSTYKIPSGELNNFQYLDRMSRNKTGSVIVSTGMAWLSEVLRAVEFLKGKGLPESQLTVLHCTSQYPADLDALNMKAMTTLRQATGLAVGYSDHSDGCLAGVLSVALGGQVLERHVTLDRSMEGPDHKASDDPQSFRAYCEAVREAEVAMGDGAKVPMATEMDTREVARKSIFARTQISPGDVLSRDNLVCMRPGTGIPAELFGVLEGRLSSRRYSPGDPIEIG